MAFIACSPIALRYLPSLRVWLQSTSLLVVVAGYSLVYAVGRQVFKSEYLEGHRVLVSDISSDFIRDPASLDSTSGSVRAAVVTGVDPVDPYISSKYPGRTLVSSVTPLPLYKPDASLVVVQDISDEENHHQKIFASLLIAGSVSIFLTAILLRLVIWRGLVLPLQLLHRELDAIVVDSLGAHTIDADSQPREFQQIVRSINQLQTRLSMAWAREREFVDGAAHELRTPITVISSTAQRLSSSRSGCTQASLDLIGAESKRLSDLLATMLDFARVDAGRLSVSMANHDPERLILDAFERLEVLAGDRLRLAASGSVRFPLIKVDEQRLQQCLAAIVDNALLYSSGTVQLALALDSDRVIFHVIDQGDGFAEAECDAVLQRFYRGKASIGTRGSGMGLSIVDELVRLMNGELVLASNSSGGADVQLQFTFSRAQPLP